jgi:hypothetical protein
VDWIHLAQDRYPWLDLANMSMNFPLPLAWGGGEIHELAERDIH